MANVSLGNRRPLSLNNRVMLFVAIAITFSLVLIGYLVQNTVERHFEEQDADELVVITHAVAEALETASKEGVAPESILDKAVSGHHGVYFQVWDENHQLIFASNDFQSPSHLSTLASLSRIHAGNLYQWVIGDKTYRSAISLIHIGDAHYRVVAAIDMGFHIHFLESFGQTLWLIMILAGVVTLVAAWFGVHQGHEPLRALSEAMQEIQADHLEVRLDTNTIPAELITLVDSFNLMISRLEESFNRLSHFSADIAHELRTPLTNLITQTQVGLSKSRGLEEYRELLYSNLEEQERLTKMVNDMLWLAQNENGLLDPAWESLDLFKEVKATFDFFQALADEKGIRLQVEGKGGTIIADRSMLRRVLSNLLSNAIRFTPTGEAVTVKVSKTNAQVRLIVENPGTEIPAAHLPRLFDRFYRVDPSRNRESEGAGLGLSIVRSIVEAHGGTIEATSGYGVTCFSMCFPSALEIDKSKSI